MNFWSKYSTSFLLTIKVKLKVLFHFNLICLWYSQCVVYCKIVMYHLKITVNQKDRKKLSHNGHECTIKKELKTLIRWECSLCRKFECCSALKTNRDVSEIIGDVSHYFK